MPAVCAGAGQLARRQYRTVLTGTVKKMFSPEFGQNLPMSSYIFSRSRATAVGLISSFRSATNPGRAPALQDDPFLAIMEPEPQPGEEAAAKRSLQEGSLEQVSPPLQPYPGKANTGGSP